MELKSLFARRAYIRLARWAIQRAGPNFGALIEHRWVEMILPPGREAERLANRYLMFKTTPSFLNLTHRDSGTKHDVSGTKGAFYRTNNQAAALG